MKNYKILFPFKASAGFTLIELMVVFSMGIVISAVGFASFSSYSKKQTVEQAASDLKQTIEKTKYNSTNGVKPDKCGSDPLQYYTFYLDSTSRKYGINCEDPAPPTPYFEKKLPSGLSFSNYSSCQASPVCTSIRFYTLSGKVAVFSGTTPVTKCDIVISGNDNCVKLTVDEDGNVTKN